MNETFTDKIRCDCRTSLRCTTNPARRTAALCCWCERVAPAPGNRNCCGSAPRICSSNAPRHLVLQQNAEHHACEILNRNWAANGSNQPVLHTPCQSSSSNLAEICAVGALDLVFAQGFLPPLSAEPCRACLAPHLTASAEAVQSRQPAHCTLPEPPLGLAISQKPLECVLAESVASPLQLPALAAGSVGWPHTVAFQQVASTGIMVPCPLSSTRCRRNCTADPVFG